MKTLAHKNIAVAAAITVAALFFFEGDAFAKAGSSAASFLKIGQGARGAAMADAQAAITDDVNSAHWNPAGLAQMRFQELSFMHHDLVESVRYQQAAYGRPTDSRGNFAFGISMLDYGKIDAYTAGGTRNGSVEATNLLLSGSWGKRLSDKTPLAAGVTVKYLQSDLAGYKASVPMLDLGLQTVIDAGSMRGLRLAAGLRNIGPDIKYDRDGSSLPQQIVFGGGISALGGNLVVASDIINAKDTGTHIATGLEYRVFRLLQLRLGYTTLADFVGNGLSYGMGLRFTTWNLDYAFVPFGDLGNTNRISVGVRFGRALQLQHADEQVESSYRLARRQLALGNGVLAYSTLNDLLLIAPWHKPSVELKAKIEKMFEEMAVSKNKAKMESEIAETFTNAKVAFDRDELVTAKKGFETILMLQPEHVGSKVYLERIQNRYAALAQESFKQGMSYYAAGDYEKAKMAFEKTLTIDQNHADAAAQLAKSKELMQDAGRRKQELELLAGAGDAYKAGLEMFQKNDLEGALTKFQEVQLLIPEYEEVGRYLDLTKTTLAGVLYEQSQVNLENGNLEEAVAKLKRASQLAPADNRVATGLKVAERDLQIKNAQESVELYKKGLEMFLGGDTAKAEQLWKKSLELDPNNEEALKAISKLEEQRKYGAQESQQ
jgi:tetratricopeptide (TPR) repeat protein